MRISILFGAAIALALGACDAGYDESEFESDANDQDAPLSSEEVANRIAKAQSCALAHDKIGNFYLTLSEVEDDPAEATKFREMAEEKLPIIQAFNEYAQGMKEDHGVSDADFAASEQQVTARVDQEFESREMEDFLNLMAEAADRCTKQVESGAFG